MSDSSLKSFDLLRDVVAPDYCIGCGLCALATSKIEINLNQSGFYVPHLRERLDHNEQTQIAKLCPFSYYSLNEDQLNLANFSEAGNENPYIGRNIERFAIRVTEGTFRENGSSAGFGSWVLCELLRTGLVDAVIHVGVTKEGVYPSDTMFGYIISTTPEEVQQNCKTKYYPIEMSKVLRAVQDDPRKFAMVGLPCFIKGIQNLRAQSPIWRDRICFTVSLFCGHLKSHLFTENLIRESRVALVDVKSFAFRSKLPNTPANRYTLSLYKKNGDHIQKDWGEIFGAEWATGVFKYNACNFCDDVVGETSDISIGDAWLPQYKNDGMGTNNVVIRSPILHSIVTQAISQDRLWAEKLSLEQVHQSTAGGFRDRREGLSQRLDLHLRAGLRPPKKRVQPMVVAPKERSELYALKLLIGEISIPAYLLSRSAGSSLIFKALLSPLFLIYKRKRLHFILRFSFFSNLAVWFLRRKRKKSNCHSL